LAGTCALVALLATSSRGEESLQPVAEWLTSIGVKNGSKEYDAESLSKLYMLRLAVKKQVDDEAIKTHVSRLTSLGSLSLDATSVTDAGLEHLASLTKLRALDLGSLKGVTGAGFEHLAKLPALEELTLQSSGVSVDDLKKLPAVLPKLKSLKLGWLKVDGAVADLAALKNLQSLDLFHTDLTDSGAKGLAAMEELQKLYLWNTAITDEGLANIKGLTNLTLLYISDTKVTDAGMAHLSGLEKLDYLWMNNLPVTDAGLKALASCKALTSVQARDTKITDAGVAALVAAVPKVRVSK
jgi:Leucine-rich repeat (LRR) protein